MSESQEEVQWLIAREKEERARVERIEHRQKLDQAMADATKKIVEILSDRDLVIMVKESSVGDLRRSIIEAAQKLLW